MKKYPDMYEFPAIFKKVEGKLWEVWFPDLEACCSSMDSRESAILEAREVLENFLYGMEKQKFDIPAPSDLKNINVSGPQDFTQLVVANMPPVRRAHANKAVKKTLT
ncbi:type II toxin-antitoxin system HicB family antitoxin [Synergistaceae bacterium OttesenSCG-928-D05]|nr:type II toxin-antitoxin system HicB family antitoxin [Synergistaceae bacterium OttesenSCG-928-D05]